MFLFSTASFSLYTQSLDKFHNSTEHPVLDKDFTSFVSSLSGFKTIINVWETFHNLFY